jgi:hypothetical protein
MVKDKKIAKVGEALEAQREEIMSGCYWQKADGENFTTEELTSIINN